MLKPDEAYQNIFRDYPDVVNVKQLCKMLGSIGEKTGYRLLHSGKIRYFTIGRSYRIPKINVIDYLSVISNNPAN
jgi:excisionase family DNA binding protein